MEPETAHGIASFVAANCSARSETHPITVETLTVMRDRNGPDAFNVESNIRVDVAVRDGIPYVMHEQLLDLLDAHNLALRTIGQFGPDQTPIETDDTVMRIWVEPTAEFTRSDIPSQFYPDE